jgi:hypothetical protein
MNNEVFCTTQQMRSPEHMHIIPMNRNDEGDISLNFKSQSRIFSGAAA